MKILQTVKKIPGGLMVVPLLLGAIVSRSGGGILASLPLCWRIFF